MVYRRTLYVQWFAYNVELKVVANEVKVFLINSFLRITQKPFIFKGISLQSKLKIFLLRVERCIVKLCTLNIWLTTSK